MGMSEWQTWYLIGDMKVDSSCQDVIMNDATPLKVFTLLHSMGSCQKLLVELYQCDTFVRDMNELEESPADEKGSHHITSYLSSIKLIHLGGLCQTTTA